VVANATAAGANAIFAQVRRRGDAWYRDALEPLPDGVPIAAGFDPLAELIAQAHAADLEVHAFVIIGAVWNRPPTQPPSSAEHVFNRHGFDPQTGQPHQGRAKRFQRHHGLPEAGPPPDPGDPHWSQWRRDQVTALVRRIYRTGGPGPKRAWSTWRSR
jgi:uncharacterized lipoprotein YddW (UPF0748 family)